MKKNARIAFCVTVAALAFLGTAALMSGRACAEETKADEALFANDLGPAEIDVSSYPEDIQKTYRSLFKRCAKCHSLARPLNSQYLELDKAELAGFQKTLKEKGAGDDVILVDEGIWNRYVKRMMRKPGSGIRKSEGRKIWEFLRYDSKARKTGASLDAWIERRRKQLEEFKARYPKKYLENYGAPKE